MHWSFAIFLCFSRHLCLGLASPFLHGGNLDAGGIQCLLLGLASGGNRCDFGGRRCLSLDSCLLDNSGLARANEAKQSSEHAKEGEGSGGETGSDLGHLLDGLDNVKAAEVCNVSCLSTKQKLTNELVNLELGLVKKAHGVLVLFVIKRTLGLLLNRLLDVVSLLGQVLGVGGGVTNVDVVD